MSTWRLAFTRRWLGIFALTTLFAVACIGLGQWQFARRAEAQAAISVLERNYDRAVVDIADVVREPTEFDETEKWRPVRLVGEYDSESVVYVRTRSGLNGIGFEQLAVLRLPDGTAFVVNRGWVPANSDNSAPSTTPAIPTGRITLTARLMPGESQIDGRDAPPGQIATIHLPTIDSWVEGDVFSGWYGRLASESPAGEFGATWEKPVLDEGPHLSYALQWYVFAVMGFIAFGWAIRKEVRADSIPKRPRLRRTPSDEDIEDAALDAMRAR